MGGMNMLLIQNGYAVSTRRGVVDGLFSAVLALALFQNGATTAQEVKQLKRRAPDRLELNIIPQGAVYRFTRRRTMASANAPDVLHSPVRSQRRPLRSSSSPPTARDPSPPHSDNPGFAARERRPRRAPVAARSRAAPWSRYPRRTRSRPPGP